MTLSAQQALRLAMIAAATLSLAACASQPKPQPVAPKPAPPAPAPRRAVVAPVTQGPLAGSEQDFVINVGDRVYFDLDQYELRADAAPVLNAQAAWLVRYGNVAIRIEGNADERGTREYNIALGARRANTVRDFLVGHGVAASRLTVISYGKERPIDPGTGEDAYQHNRNGHTAIVNPQ